MIHEHSLAGNTIWVAGGTGIVLVTSSLSFEAVVADRAFPVVSAWPMGIAVVNMLVQSIPGVEVAIAMLAVWHIDGAVSADLPLKLAMSMRQEGRRWKRNEGTEIKEAD